MTAIKSMPFLVTMPDRRSASSADVLCAAQSRLNNSSYLELRRIQCGFQGGVLTLRGCVSTHYLRQVAQAAVLGLAGLKAIDNQLQVLPRILQVDCDTAD
ncbi:MAG TPA: BON domain-containing protein [Gemmataceae bacterium]|nr:BON domain-containing protein [Gemmataceae bacterium]